MRVLLIAIALAAPLVGAVGAGAGSPSAGAAATAVVQVRDFLFRPDYTRIEPGDAVEWRVAGVGPHTVTARNDAPAPFHSGELVQGDRFAFTFAQAGSYRYVCRIHSWMHGTVQVGPDTVAPELTRARVTVGRTHVRVGFRLSEMAEVKAVLKRRGRPGRRKLVSPSVDAGRRTLITLRAGLKPGGYTARIVATDREGNVSRVSRRFRIPELS